jgi:hypothetical protein
MACQHEKPRPSPLLLKGLMHLLERHGIIQQAVEKRPSPLEFILSDSKGEDGVCMLRCAPSFDRLTLRRAQGDKAVVMVSPSAGSGQAMSNHERF